MEVVGIEFSLAKIGHSNFKKYIFQLFLKIDI